MFTNWLATNVRSMLSMRCLCTLHTATQFSLLCVSVLLSQVFSLLRALNERSASHEETGQTSSNRKSCSTFGKRDRISGTMSRRDARTSNIVLGSKFCDLRMNNATIIHSINVFDYIYFSSCLQILGGGHLI